MPPLIVLMGVAGSGKSTVGPLVAARLGVPFFDGDDAHSPEAKAQIVRNEPLTASPRPDRGRGRPRNPRARRLGCGGSRSSA